METDRVKQFYDAGVAYEWRRLDRHPVEFEITKRHVAEYLGTSPLCIADIGGGPGKYSFHFARQGHRVTLVDLSSKNIEFAQNKAVELGLPLEGYFERSATTLSGIASETFDVVLCLGPMYHMRRKLDHTRVIEECRRILKSDGLLSIAFLTPWAHAFSIMENDPDGFSELKSFYAGLVDSQRNVTDTDIEFPNGWNPKPENVAGYMESHYFRTERLVALEGPFGRHFERIHGELSERAYTDWMDYIYQLSTEKSLIGSCEHLLYMGRKL